MHELLAIEVLLFDLYEWGTLGLVRLSGYQPQYFPRLHYFARMFDSHIFTIADYLQYVRKHVYEHKDGSRSSGVSYQAHVPIKTRAGVETLGIPVQRALNQTIREAKIDYSTDWYDTHLNIIHDSYHKAPNFDTLYPDLVCLLTFRHASLADLTCSSIIWGLARLFELPVGPRRDSASTINALLPIAPFRLERLILLSERVVAPPDKEKGRDANEWLIEQCKVFGADEYHFGGTSAQAYMDFNRFAQSNIALSEQNWQCREYPQLYGAFVPNLSIVDLLMNVSPREAREILHTPATRI
ncbi:MAG TPA: WbqC family protein [Candidatus Paceibacterota bacterium]|nr:WbqC family protein [Candidatus Paceibacterota bacterium]